jgi:membrane-bound serine protease (ClpP class)
MTNRRLERSPVAGFKRYHLLLPLLLLAVSAVLPTAASRAATVDTIPIQGEIDRTLVVFLRRSIDQATREGAQVLLFDINTFGGRVDSALQIATLIGSVKEATTVAFVTTAPESTGVSWSAGALISFSCNRIYMAPGTSLGAAAPVIMGAQGTQAASEKVVSAMRAQVAALAEKNGYPEDIARAMVDEDIELKEIFVDGKLRVITSEELEVARRNAEREGKNLEVGRTISPAGKLLTLTAREMERYGVSSGTVEGEDELLRDMGVERTAGGRIEPTASDRAVEFITSSGFTSILILIGLVALFVEITSPGFGVPGTIAIIAFAVVFAGYGLLGTVGSLELILFVLGLVLLILEIFVIPGFGIAGVSGIVLIVASLVFSMQGFVLPEFEWQKGLFRRNLLVVSMSTVSAFVVFAVLAYALPQLRLFSRLTLSTAQSTEEGYTAQSRDELGLLGKRGRVITTLRPVGKAEIGDEQYYVETEGEFLEVGSEVEVIEVSGNRIVVRRC